MKRVMAVEAEDSRPPDFHLRKKEIPKRITQSIAPIQSARAPKLAVDARPEGLDCSVAMLKVTAVAPAPATNAGGVKTHDACGGKFKHEKVTGC